jgi:hypothetical protein
MTAGTLGTIIRGDAMTTRPCDCGSLLARFPKYDARGIFLCYVCEKCEQKKLAAVFADAMKQSTQTE